MEVASTQGNPSKKLLLIVDDDPLLLNLYSRMFKKHGVEIVTAEDGEDGLNKTQAILPGVIILDMRMPKKDGVQVLTEIRNDPKTKDIPVIILTNFNNEEYRNAVKELNPAAFMIKTDIDPEGLVKKALSLF